MIWFSITLSNGNEKYFQKQGENITSLFLITWISANNIIIKYISESRANILGSKDLYMKEGSEVELSCKVVDSPRPPAYIYWYKGEEVINYSTRKGIEVSFSNLENNAISTLLIKVGFNQILSV